MQEHKSAVTAPAPCRVSRSASAVARTQTRSHRAREGRYIGRRAACAAGPLSPGVKSHPYPHDSGRGHRSREGLAIEAQVMEEQQWQRAAPDGTDGAQSHVWHSRHTVQSAAQKNQGAGGTNENTRTHLDEGKPEGRRQEAGGAPRQRGRPPLPQGTQTPLPFTPARSANVQKGLPSPSTHGGSRRPPQSLGICAAAGASSATARSSN